MTRRTRRKEYPAEYKDYLYALGTMRRMTTRACAEVHIGSPLYGEMEALCKAIDAVGDRITGEVHHFWNDGMDTAYIGSRAPQLPKWKE